MNRNKYKYKISDKVYFICKGMSLYGVEGKILRAKRFLFWKKYLIAKEYTYYDSTLYWVKEKNIIKKL